MENASKALIIAGAILLAIAIIGVGMFVFQQVSGIITDNSDFSSKEIDAYNQPFTVYEGTNVKGTNAKSLCSKINSHNLAAKDPSELIVLVDGEVEAQVPAPTAEGAAGTTSTDINKIKNSILSGKTYTVTIATDPNTGFVSSVGISMNK